MIPCVFISAQGLCAVTMTTSPRFSVSLWLSLSLSQAAAASWASGHTRTQPPSHIESPPPPCPKSLQLFFFYTVTYSRLTGSALAAPPLKGTGHVRQRAHVDDTDCASVASPSASDSQSASKSASTMAVSKMKAHRCWCGLTWAGLLLCMLYCRCRCKDSPPKECKYISRSHFARPKCVDVRLKHCYNVIILL